jgi:hypothetical protein
VVGRGRGDDLDGDRDLEREEPEVNLVWKLTGTPENIRSFQRFGARLGFLDLTPLGVRLLRDARGMVPVRTGNLKSHIYVRYGPNRVMLGVGGTRYHVYAHYGARTFPNPVPFISDPVERANLAWYVNRAVAQARREAGL